MNLEAQKKLSNHIVKIKDGIQKLEELSDVEEIEAKEAKSNGY
jgi:hypothetical protein